MKCTFNPLNSTNTSKWRRIDWKKVDKTVAIQQKRITVAALRGDFDKVKRYQEVLVNSFSARVLAVKRVTSSSGGKTTGVDNITWKTDDQKFAGAEALRDLKGYSPSPVRRVYIPKANGKKRPLGIPTIHDRAMQALFLLALDPVSEALADANSFGFRKGRSTHHAVYFAYEAMRGTKGAKVVLDADIKGFFDNISHDWILANIPMDKRILKLFLEAGFIELGRQELTPTEAGVPQGGVISPTIANMVLDGLPQAIMNEVTKRKAYRKDFPLTVVRYADDFMVIGYNEDIMKKIVLPTVKTFLTERGLELSEEKTKIVNLGTLDNSVKFLGFTFERKPYTKYNRNRSVPYLRIAESKLSAIKDKLKSVFDGSKSSLKIVESINPIITGWCNYFKVANASKEFRDLSRHLWNLQYRWAKRKFRGLNNTQIMNKCFAPGGKFFGQAKDKRVMGKTFTDFKISYLTKPTGLGNPYLVVKDDKKPVK